MRVDHYAQRLLNPFRGCVQVIRFASAEAVSMDGVLWDIYVSDDSLLAGLDLAPGKVQISDIRYGSWSAAKGLKRGPLYPSEDFYRMEAMGTVVYEHLLQIHDKVPFPFRDRFECWLMDRDRRPLVLLDSAVGAPNAAEAGTGHWQIGHVAMDHFTSSVFAFANPDATAKAAQCLMDFVNAQAAGTIWFLREPDGSGTPLCPEDGPPLPADAFPQLLIRECHDMVADYIAWQAPWLLLLDGLPAATRNRLEQCARVQATEVERLHRLYPEVANPDLIQAARVEARLTQSPAAKSSAPDVDLSTFYIELDPDEPG